MTIGPTLWVLSGVVASALSLAAVAQPKSAADGIAEYRRMLEDGNPAELFEAKGENLWQTPRGPKNASLAPCDLGKGAGVVKGSFIALPRYFADTQRVQDLESRLLTCMETLQGFSENGRSMTWSDPSAASSANGGNCCNCHQLSKAEISFGTIGPSLHHCGKMRGVADPASEQSRPIVEHVWGKLYNAKAYNACSGMPRFGHAGMLDETQLKHLMALLLDPKSPVNE